MMMRQTQQTGSTPDAAPLDTPQVTLSLFETYSGYALTQGRDALENIVLWEKVLRFGALVLAAGVAALWLGVGVEQTRDTVTMKAILSVILLGLCLYLLWISRGRMQHEVRIDLIHRELNQVLRSAAGAERVLLTVAFDQIESLFIRRNRDLAVASALFMRLFGEDEPVLLATGTAPALEDVHRRMAEDLSKARRMPVRPHRSRVKSASAGGLRTA